MIHAFLLLWAAVLCAVTTARAEPLNARLLWEVGTGEEVFFGVISGLDVDDEGNVFVLDRQMTVVSMFSPDGEYLGPVGREGEGPGEYSRVVDVGNDQGRRLRLN